VDCEDFREALSARLDNEEDIGAPADAHLEYCADCAYWFDAAALITRRTRTSAVVAWPDVADAVLARVPPASDRSPMRFGLGAVGVLQCVTGMVTVVGGGFESGAWQLALGFAVLVLVVLLGQIPPVRRGPAPPKPVAGGLHYPDSPSDNGDAAHLVIRAAKTA
jgi:predicted anti-sigma-YlaC factor YlaD